MNKQLNAGQVVRSFGDLGLAPGALAGGLLTVPLIGIMYLLDNLFRLPFVPFALFDWIAKVLPGPVVTLGIDMMIDSIRLVGFSVADVAKTAEQAIAVLLFLVLGVIAISLFFAVMRWRDIAPKPISGLIVALSLGLPMTVVSIPMGQSDLDPSVVVLGVLVPFLIWGAACVFVYRRLSIRSGGLPTEDEVRWAKSINRREFLVRLGAASATIVVVSSGVGGLLAQRERREINESIAATMDDSAPRDRGPFPNAGDPVQPALWHPSGIHCV